MCGPKEIVRAGYDQAAESYLAARPSDGGDVALLADLRARVPDGSPVLDAGCGAGMPVTDALVSMGLRAVGLDFSPGQLTLARRRHLAATCVRGDLAALPFADGSFAAVVSYYAIIHVPRDEHATVVREVSRVLWPGGWALLCLGLGDLVDDHDPESWLGVPMYWSHFGADVNVALVRDAGLHVEWTREVPDPMSHGAHLFVLAERR